MQIELNYANICSCDYGLCSLLSPIVDHLPVKFVSLSILPLLMPVAAKYFNHAVVVLHAQLW